MWLNKADWIGDKVIFQHNNQRYVGKLISMAIPSKDCTIMIGSFITVRVPEVDVLKRQP